MFTETQHRTLLDECTKWLTELSSYRAKMNDLKNELYYFAPGKTDQDILLGIEHFHNQFHIQLINIHDLKHEIRYHVSEAQKHPTFGHQIPHHYMEEKLGRLLSDLDNLDKEFHAFIKQ